MPRPESLGWTRRIEQNFCTTWQIGPDDGSLWRRGRWREVGASLARMTGPHPSLQWKEEQRRRGEEKCEN